MPEIESLELNSSTYALGEGEDVAITAPGPVSIRGGRTILQAAESCLCHETGELRIAAHYSGRGGSSHVIEMAYKPTPAELADIVIAAGRLIKSC